MHNRGVSETLAIPDGDGAAAEVGVQVRQELAAAENARTAQVVTCAV